jgi:hypothetical protein
VLIDLPLWNFAATPHPLAANFIRPGSAVVDAPL